MHLSKIKFSKSTAVLLVLVVAIVTYATSMVQLAQAESSVLGNPKVNVFFRYGISPALETGKYDSSTMVYYKSTGFEPTTSTFNGDYGSFTGVGNYISMWNLHSDEQIIATDVLYRLSNGKYLHLKWSGRTPIKVYTRLAGRQAYLVYANVGVHSDRLSNQVPSGPPVPSGNGPK